MTPLNYVWVDVFTSRAYGGNPLPVVVDCPPLSAEAMLRITQEFRQFETIFLGPVGADRRVPTRVFDLFEELPFAGHPLLGAAAVLHAQAGLKGAATWSFDLNGRIAPVTVERAGGGYRGLLDQGAPAFLGEAEDRAGWAVAFGLAPQDLHPALPLRVTTTGLRYLVIPVAPGVLPRARVVADLTERLEREGAQFAVLLDEAALEVRHWNNDGVMEDAATGSAAGVVGAYRLHYGLARAGEPFTLKQGRFAGRPSELRVIAEGAPGAVTGVKVGGEIVVVGRGALEALP